MRLGVNRWTKRSKLLAVPARNTDAVEVGGYDAISDGAASAGTNTYVANGITYIPIKAGNSIYSNCDITKISFRTLADLNAAEGASFKLGIWRLGPTPVDGTTEVPITMVGHRDITGATIPAGLQEYTLSPSIQGVRPGDFVGWYSTGYTAAADWFAQDARVSYKSYMLYNAATAAITDIAAVKSNVETNLLRGAMDIKSYGRAPDIVCIGDSIMSAASLNGYWSLPMERPPTSIRSTYNPDDVPIHRVASLFGWKYANLAISGPVSTSARLRATFQNDVIDHHANFVLLDIGEAITETYQEDYEAILTMAEEAGIVAICVPVWPFSDSTALSDRQLSYTQSLWFKSLVASHPTALWADVRPVLGTFSETDQAWLANPALWDATTSHYNAAGYRAMGDEIARLLYVHLFRASKVVSQRIKTWF